MRFNFLALAAAAGLAGTATAATAADLGGSCCADLEERVAELEATAARKGNRKVKLTVSGQVQEQIMWWDDGVEQNVYQVASEVARTRFRFVGDAKINSDWSAGYLMEIGLRSSRQDRATADTDDGATGVIDVRHSVWWLQSKQFGKVWVGQTSSSTDGITEVNLANVGHFHSPSVFDLNGGFNIRQKNGTNVIATRLLSNNSDGFVGEGTRFNVVKYDSPTIAGFVFSASYGEDDMWDVTLRYAGAFSGFKLAAGIGYASQTDLDGSVGDQCAILSAPSTDVSCQSFGASGSVMHVDSGLFVFGSYGWLNDDKKRNVLATAEDTETNWLVMAGIEQKWFPVGKTTVYGEYMRAGFGTPFNGATVRTFGGVGIQDSDVRVWGFGINQSIEAAAMDLYVQYRNYDYDINLTNGNRVSTEQFSTVIAGGIIKF